MIQSDPSWAPFIGLLSGEKEHDAQVVSLWELSDENGNLTIDLQGAYESLAAAAQKGNSA